jgi:hypothetical protein
MQVGKNGPQKSEEKCTVRYCCEMLVVFFRGLDVAVAWRGLGINILQFFISKSKKYDFF